MYNPIIFWLLVNYSYLISVFSCYSPIFKGYAAALLFAGAWNAEAQRKLISCTLMQNRGSENKKRIR